MPAEERTVLVVDDDADLRMMVGLVLEAEGYVVRRAADGLEALEQFEGELPDLVLLDMRMPRMDGWELGRRLRSQYGRALPVVVMTAAEHAERHAEEIGADGFVAKPFDIGHLLTVVSRHLRR
jgi:two-component system, chemotaxis family, chemotaxis protein CheY